MPGAPPPHSGMGTLMLATAPQIERSRVGSDVRTSSSDLRTIPDSRLIDFSVSANHTVDPVQTLWWGSTLVLQNR